MNMLQQVREIKYTKHIQPTTKEPRKGPGPGGPKKANIATYVIISIGYNSDIKKNNKLNESQLKVFEIDQFQLVVINVS